MSHWLIHLLDTYGLLIVFVTMVAESACIPIPSEVVVPYGGLVVSHHHGLVYVIIVVGLVATAANLVGSGIAYWVGRTGGRALFLRYGKYVLVTPHHLDRADSWFARRGQLTVFFTRMMPGVRTVISLPAGIAEMPFAKFLLYTFLGSIPWNFALAYLGYVFSSRWEDLQALFSRYNDIFYIVLAGVVIALIGWGIYRWRRNRNRGSEGAADACVKAGTSDVNE
jgi:membrane protein DedA with SNARE-associated domain